MSQPTITREQFIAELEMLVVDCIDPDYDAWKQSLRYDLLRRRAGLFYDRVAGRVRA